ncbi:unnamed protein product [Brassicogethes aeneus]|uniref:Uncharacterized protein n=1 Tax=Brassicogethes aeneus TaxID=1431903 RepID=A0A9P0B0Y4_BRAAE|nr:unnamed protein product [Brassicogethes aeneus]
MTYTSETFLSTKSFLSLTREQRKCRKYDEAEDLPNSPLYSKKLCKIECRMRLCLKYCGCLPYYYRNFNGEKICNLTELYCLSQYEDELVTLRKGEKSLCNCDNVCESTLYNVYTAYCTEWLGESNLVIRLSQFPIIRYKGNLKLVG